MVTNIKITSFMTAMFMVATALLTPQEQPNDEPNKKSDYERDVNIVMVTMGGLILLFIAVVVLAEKRSESRWCWACVASNRAQRQTNDQHAEKSGQHAKGDIESNTKTTRAANFSLPRVLRILSRGRNGMPDKTRSVNKIEQIELEGSKQDCYHLERGSG